MDPTRFMPQPEQQPRDRVRRRFHYVNADDQEGFIEVAYGPWGGPREAPIMVSFDDARWMGAKEAEEFARWFHSAMAEAKRLHVGRA